MECYVTLFPIRIILFLIGISIKIFGENFSICRIQIRVHCFLLALIRCYLLLIANVRFIRQTQILYYTPFYCAPAPNVHSVCRFLLRIVSKYFLSKIFSPRISIVQQFSLTLWERKSRRSGYGPTSAV